MGLWFGIKGLDEYFNNACLNLVSVTSSPDTVPKGLMKGQPPNKAMFGQIKSLLDSFTVPASVYDLHFNLKGAHTVF